MTHKQAAAAAAAAHDSTSDCHHGRPCPHRHSAKAQTPWTPQIVVSTRTAQVGVRIGAEVRPAAAPRSPGMQSSRGLWHLPSRPLLRVGAFSRHVTRREGARRAVASSSAQTFEFEDITHDRWECLTVRRHVSMADSHTNSKRDVAGGLASAILAPGLSDDGTPYAASCLRSSDCTESAAQPGFLTMRAPIFRPRVRTKSVALAAVVAPPEGWGGTAADPVCLDPARPRSLPASTSLNHPSAAPDATPFLRGTTHQSATHAVPSNTPAAFKAPQPTTEAPPPPSPSSSEASSVEAAMARAATTTGNIREVFGSDASTGGWPSSSSSSADSAAAPLQPIPAPATACSGPKGVAGLTDADGSCSSSSSSDDRARSDASSTYDPDAELTTSDADDVPEFRVGGGCSGPIPVTSLEDYCAYLFLSGQCNVTEASYDIFRKFYNNDRPQQKQLRDKTTIRRVVAPAIRAQWGLKMEEASVAATREAGGPIQVSYILPSTHVKRDVAFRDTYNLFFAASGPDADPELEPEYCDSPMHLDRRQVTCPLLVSRFNIDGTIYAVGDQVTIELDANQRIHGLTIATPEYASASAGLKESSAVRAGDFLLPCLRRGALVGHVVSPHWLTSDAAKLSWHPVVGDVCQVVSIDTVTIEAARTAGVSPTRCSRSVRTVDSDGNITLHLSIGAFTDDFQVHEGKSTSAGTVAFNYPQWRYRHKASRHAVRYIGVSPSGVSSDEILRLVTPDLREGCTTGWLGKDPDGNDVRIIADVSSFIGDYTQVAKSSHLRGVRADAPCTVCSYRKAKEAGSQYGGNGDSSDVSMARTTPRTLAVISALGSIQD